MENNQNIGDVINSKLENVNANNQIKATLDLVNIHSAQIISLREDHENLKNGFKAGRLKECVDDIRDIKKKQSSFKRRIKNLEEKIKYLKESKTEETHWIKKIPSWFWMVLFIFIGCIASIFVMIYIQQHYGFGIKENSASIILTFVGIAATFVVVSNYVQIKEIEGKLDKKIKDKINDYDNTVSGSIHILLGRIAFDKGTVDGHILAFFYYVDALEYIDKSSDKRSIGGVFLGIKELADSEVVIKTTEEYRAKAIYLLDKYPEENDLHSYVRGIEIFKE
jgi:hypothetical protein